MKRKYLIFILTILLVMASIVGCNNQEKNPDTNTPPENVPGNEDQIEENGNNTNGTNPNDDMESETSMKKYKDGEYTAELDEDEKGWRSVIKLEVKDNEISNVEYDELDENDKKKSENKDYNEKWKAASDIDSSEAYPQLEEELMEVQDVEKIDNITGATDASEDFKEVVNKALKDAVE